MYGKGAMLSCRRRREYDPANRYMLFKNSGISMFDTYFNSITAEKWKIHTNDSIKLL